MSGNQTEVNAAARFGEIITWTIKNVFLRRDAVEAALRSAGFDTVPVRWTTASTYLRRAIEQAVTDGAVRKIGEDDHRIAYAVVSEEKNLAAAIWRVQQVEAVSLDKATGALTFRADNSITRAIRKSMRAQEGGLLSAGVGLVLRGALQRDCAALTLRPGGGVYYVPAAHVEKVVKLETAIMALVRPPMRIRVHRMGVIVGAREARDLGELYADSVRAEVARARAEAAELLKDLEMAKPSSFVRRAKALRALIAQINLYNATLGVGFGDVKQCVEQMAVLMDRCARACSAARAKARDVARKQNMTGEGE